MNISYTIPSFTDLDNDGDLDAIIGSSYRGINYYENIGNASQPQFEKRLDHPFSEIKGYAAPSFADLDNDGDEDAIIGDLEGNIHYYINNQSHPLPDNYALPNGGLYHSPRLITLGCLQCKTIYYTLDGTTPTRDSIVFTTPFNLTENTTLKFVTVDEQENLSQIVTERYIFDKLPPQIIFQLVNPSVVAELSEIQGTALDEGSGLERFELQIINNQEQVYLTDNKTSELNETLTWLLVNQPFQNKWFYDLSAVSLPLGTYTIKARAIDNAGNATVEEITISKVEQARTDLFLKLDRVTLPNNKTLNGTGTLVSRRFPKIEEDLVGLPIQLSIEDPLGQVTMHETTILSNIGQYEFQNLGGFTQSGQYKLTAYFTGNELLTEAVSSTQTVLVGKSAGYAVIVQGRIANGEGLEAHNKTTNRIYKTLKERSFEDENIYYYNSYDPHQTGIEIDGQPNTAQFVTLTEQLQARMNGSPAPFYMILIDHGDRQGHFYVGQEEPGYVTPNQWANWLDQLEAGLSVEALQEPRMVMLGFCYSGKALETLTQAGRVVIASAAATEESYKGTKESDGIRSGEFFMEALFQQLGRGDSFQSAFEQATSETEQFTRRGGTSSNTAEDPFGDGAVQHPLLALNGGQGQNILSAVSSDHIDLSQLQLGAGAEYDTNFVGNPADILSVTETVYLSESESAAELFVTVNEVSRVKDATVNIRRPSLILETPVPQRQGSAEQREIEDLLEINLLCYFDKRCTRNSDDFQENLFDEPGQYELYYFVTDNETHDISPIWRSVVYKNKVGNQPPAPFELYTPVNGSETFTGLRFNWADTTDHEGDKLTYTLIIAEDEAFEHVVYRQEELRESEYWLPLNLKKSLKDSKME
ncbi:MAG: hypothetical protein HC877_13390 [Thioploca sp.]|nr:hypothetical protein [Thioploca sp.]